MAIFNNKLFKLSEGTTNTSIDGGYLWKKLHVVIQKQTETIRPSNHHSSDVASVVVIVQYIYIYIIIYVCIYDYIWYTHNDVRAINESTCNNHHNLLVSWSTHKIDGVSSSGLKLEIRSPWPLYYNSCHSPLITLW